MLLSNCNPLIPYVVCKGTKCGTFKKGDTIVVQSNGDILCYQACGWLCKEEAEEFYNLEVELDISLLKKKQEYYKNKLEQLNLCIKNGGK